MRRKSNNYMILKNLISKSRRLKLPDEISYIVIYTFLYKSCSDNLKDHFQMIVKDKNITLEEAYNDPYCRELLIEDAIQLFGYHIEKPEAFLDEMINNNYSNRFFLTDFFKTFPKNIIFNEKSKDRQYYGILFDIISQKIQLEKYEYDSEINLAIKEIIYAISKLNIFEEEFPFTQVFEVISNSNLMQIESNPDYINQILSSLIACEKTSMENVYDPFIKNGDSLIRLVLDNEIGVGRYYGKESDELTYCYLIVKFIIYYFNMDTILLKNEDASESVDIEGASFDVILSRIPIAIKNYHSSIKKQNFEIAKRYKRNELEDVLLQKFGMDSESFSKDTELNTALENLLEKMDVEKDSKMEFTGEYEVLKDSEFIFLINLIDSLKDDGVMAVSISENFLFKNSLETLRKYLTFEKNYIDTIISIPEELGRNRPEVIIVFRKNKVKDNILFIDMSKNYETQRGSIMFPGLFKRNLILSSTTMNKLRDVFLNKLTISKFSNLISMSEIKENDFNLSVSRYVDTFEGEFIQLSDLVNDKQEIDYNLKKLNNKIEKMMEELNIKF